MTQKPEHAAGKKPSMNTYEANDITGSLRLRMGPIGRNRRLALRVVSRGHYVLLCDGIFYGHARGSCWRAIRVAEKFLIANAASRTRCVVSDVPWTARRCLKKDQRIRCFRRNMQEHVCGWTYHVDPLTKQ